MESSTVYLMILKVPSSFINIRQSIFIHLSINPIHFLFLMNSTISPSLFHEISDFVITKDIFSKSTTQITIEGYEIIGQPIQIQNSRYPRNSFLFNICFVFSNCEHLSLFKPMITKVNTILKEAEESIGYLSNPKKQVWYFSCSLFLEWVQRYFKDHVQANQENWSMLRLS